MISTYNLNLLAEAASKEFINCLIVGTVILAFSWVFSRWLPRAGSAVRFRLWFAALLAIAAVPLVSRLWPAGRQSAIQDLTPHPAIMLPMSVAVFAFLAWAVIAGVLLTRVATGVWQVYRLRKQATAIELDRLAPELCQNLAESKGKRPVSLLVSGQVQSPAAVGFFRPAILVPRWVFDELTIPEMRQILLHELAHLRRMDDWSNLTQQIIKALFFFHPAVWWIEKQMSLQREMACDEAVLAETGAPRAYAECLTALAEKTLIRRGLMLAQAVVGRMGQTSQRVARILQSDSRVPTRVGKSAVLAFATVLVSCAALPSHLPQIVDFRSPEATVAAALPFSPAANGGFSPPVIPAKFVEPSFGPPPVPAAKRNNFSGHPPAQSRMAAEPRANRGGGVGAVNAARTDSGPEVFVVFLENSRSASFWQVEMWHITLFRMPQTPATQGASHKI